MRVTIIYQFLTALVVYMFFVLVLLLRIWTHENEDHDAVFCRYVSHHVDINCPAAAARYLRDYPDLAQYPALDAFSHYNGREGGKSEGRIWHSELCNSVRLRTSFRQEAEAVVPTCVLPLG